MQDAQQVSRDLDEIAALLEFAGEPKFKVKAYAHAARVVNGLGGELAALIEDDRLQELEGIGPSLSRQIHELWNSGSSVLLSTLRAEQPPGAAELIRVPGLTPRRVRALHAALGIGSLDELRAACRAERVRALPGFGPKTEAQLLLACERWLNRDKDEPRRILLSKASELCSHITAALNPGVAGVHATGALRRGEETVAELELVVVSDAERALGELSGSRHVLRVNPATHSAELSDGIPLKLHAATRANLGNTLALTSGNAAHVARLRAQAAERGFALEPVRGPDALPESPVLPLREFADETALYAALGVAPVPPELRFGTDEFARANAGEFQDLLELTDIQGMLHCHTHYSDGKNSILEMALAAHERGMRYISITDHSPSAHYANGVSLDRLQQQWDEIAAVQEQVPIRILRGTEADILSDGSLDFPDAILERFDVVIASIHARHRMSALEMTKRIERALSLPLFKIWGHALGRILNQRAPIECDVPAILDALAQAPGAIEINSDPQRLDLPPLWIPDARARGIPFVISVDAHSTQGFDVLRYGVTMARRGGLRKNEVLNTLPAQAFAARVRPRA